MIPGFPVVATNWIIDVPFFADDTFRVFQVRVSDGSPPIPAGMAHIPTGAFQMGAGFNDSYDNERPVHSVRLSAFFMDQFEVTGELWLEVYSWALNHGYTFDNAGSAKSSHHPVRLINWYDAVKWCNARSEKEGLVPCYHTDSGQGSIYRTGRIDLANSAVNWTAQGYRLPTEAEWEKAARGGHNGRRFPWGETVSHSQANYASSPVDAYDVSPTRGFHPTYMTGSQPFTSPVGSFAANDYGLFDLSGNVFEWVWDAHKDTWYADARAAEDDTRGPQFQSKRGRRGGSWVFHARSLQCAYRGFGIVPTESGVDLGFRCVRGR